MNIYAPAKINLCLHITGQKADGYHLLESVVYFSQASDTLNFVLANEDALSFSGPFGASLGSDDQINLVVKARDAMRVAAGGNPCPPVFIQLEKNLPLASGIGGGSADAAATLRGLNSLWQLNLSMADLAQIGVGIGADVPMCIYSTPLVAKGIGDILDPISHFPKLPLLLVTPNVELSTRQIFTALKSKSNGSLPRLPSRATRTHKNFVSWLKPTRNDLENPARALYPSIAQALAALQQRGALFSRMSGSGATCFGIFENSTALLSARSDIAAAHPDWWTGF